LLNDLLTGEDAGGSWIETSTIPSTGGAFVANPGSFDPAGQATGTYTFEYTVAGIPPCSASSSTVTINVIAAPSATVASNATTCDLAAQGSVLDFDALVTAGDQGGTWADTDGSGVVALLATVADGAAMTLIVTVLLLALQGGMPATVYSKV
ncbi:MAG: hypothetical protein AAFR05_23230, partial [Bacteroidota bacterium]